MKLSLTGMGTTKLNNIDRCILDKVYYYKQDN